jgi:hypothetical protein
MALNIFKTEEAKAKKETVKKRTRDFGNNEEYFEVACITEKAVNLSEMATSMSSMLTVMPTRLKLRMRLKENTRLMFAVRTINIPQRNR